MSSLVKAPVARRSPLDPVKWFVFEHFELLLVMLLVASMLLINWYVDDKVAFLNFYYLPVIAAGFYLGRNSAVLSAVLIIALVGFFQAVLGLTGVPGFNPALLITMVPWAGFLILTGYVVGHLADQHKARLADLTTSYMSMLELLTFHLESSERQSKGHSYRVAERALAIGQELEMPARELENLRVAALLHELGPQDPRLLRLLEQFPGEIKELPIARSMHEALDLVQEYGRYHDHVGPDFPVDALRVSAGAKVLAVADAYETLQMPSPNRPPFSPWSALEEIERGAGQTFGSEVVRALRKVAGAPQRSITPLSLDAYRDRVTAS